jgi:hypothetical protein
MKTHATIEEPPFVCNGEINISVAIEELLPSSVLCWIRLEAI